jgi:flagellar basal body-associated protein FliL
MRTSKQDVKDVAEGYTWIVVGVILLILLIGGVGTGIWWFGVHTSGIKGAGDQQKQTNDVTNRVHWENEFNTLDQNIQSYRAQIRTAQDAVKQHPGDQFYEQNLTGVTQECILAVGEYNADVKKPIAAPWLPTNLPTSYDRTTTCGE